MVFRSISQKIVSWCQSPAHTDRINKDSSVDVTDSIALNKLKLRFSESLIPFEGLWVSERYVSDIRLGQKDTSLSDLGVLEQLLFTGRYRRQDAAETAIFENNGRIQGLDSLGWYEPVIDYADFPTNIDHIRLGKDKEHLNDYGLRVVGDTIMIYSIDCLNHTDGDCVLDTLGHQMYALLKLK